MYYWSSLVLYPAIASSTYLRHKYFLQRIEDQVLYLRPGSRLPIYATT